MSDWEDAPSPRGEWEDAPHGADDLLTKLKDYATGGISELGGSLRDIAASILKPGTEPTTTSGQIYQGAGETAAMLGSGAGAAATASVPAALKFLNDASQGQPTNFKEDYPNMMGQMTYQPKTDMGQSMSAPVNDLINDVGIPMMGLGSSLHIPDTTGMGRNPTMDAATRMEALRKAAQDAADASKKATDKGWEDAPMAKATDGPGGQQGLFDIPEAGRQMPNPYEVTPGDWRIDENGMPIKADLSMDAANTENVLQRNLFGDELPPKHELEGTPITQAMDDTRAAGNKALSDEQVQLLKDEITPTNELKTAVRDTNEPLSRDGTGGDQSPMIGPGRSQAGAINPEVFKEGFDRIKELADGTKLRAYFDGRGLQIAALRDGNPIAHVDFTTPRDVSGNAQSNFTSVDRNARGQGLATEMYKYAAELGNDVERSPTQLQGGRAMWDAFEKKGLSTDGVIKSPGNRQMGGVLFGGKQPLERVLGRHDMIPDDPDVQAALEKSRGEKDGNAFNNMESGATLAAAKRRSTAVLAAAHLVQNAGKRAFLQIKDNVVPAERAIRKLSDTEMKEVGEIIKQENFANTRLDPKAIEQLSVNQQVAYAHFRHMMDDTLRIQNEVRAANGKEPITAREAYMSHRWDGDFRRALYEAALDPEGNPKLNQDGTLQRKLVWYLAADSKFGLERQTKRLLQERPDLVFDPKVDDHVVKTYRRQTDLQSSYSTMLDILGRDDPAVAKIRQVLEDQAQNEAASFLNQEKHFKEQSGVRGYVGDRPGRIGSKSETLAMIQQQVDYARNAYNWSEMQRAGMKLKALITDPELRQNQPNNVKYIRDYFKNAIGHGEHAAIAALEDSIKNIGISPTVVAKGLGGTKSFFIMQKIGASLGYTISNLIQHINILPHLLSSEFGGAITRSGSLITAIPVGIGGGIAMALGHYASYIRDIKGLSPDTANFYLRAAKYAEDNGITMRSIMDDAPLSQSFSNFGRGVRGFGGTITAPETFARSMAFMTAIESLRQSSKFKSEMELFQKAEDLVNMAMVDYRTSEKPMLFRKLGILGDFMNTLQTYPMNWYNQWNYMGREALKGNAAPFFAMIAAQYAVAGAMGIPGFNDMDKLYQLIKDNMLSSRMYMKAQQSEFWTSPKMWMLNHMGTSAVYGWLSDKTGIGLTNRVNAPGFSDMIQAPGGPAVDIAKQLYHAGKAIADPNRDTIAQSAMASAPSGLQGMAEYAPPFQGSTIEKDANGQTLAMMPGQIEKHQGVYRRTPAEDTIRKLGLRSTPETIEREAGYLMGRATSKSQELARNIPDEFYAKLKVGDKDAAKELYQAYVKLTGKGISNNQLEQQIVQNYTTTYERSAKAAKSVAALQNVARMQAILEQIHKEVGK